MDYKRAYELLDSVETDNLIEMLVADVQYMRLCQRESKNKLFYDYSQRAQSRLNRIKEEMNRLNEHQRQRVVYAETDFHIVRSTYFYYVGLTDESIEAIEQIDPNGAIEADTAQLLNYLYNINPQLGIYAEAGVGGNMRFITEMESVGTLNTFGIESSVKTTQKYDNTFSFAFQAGLGFEIAKNLRIGCSIYNLGKGDVKGEETVKTTTLNDNISNTNTDYRTFGSIQPIMVLGRVGFSF